MALTLPVDPLAPDDRALLLAAEVIRAGGIIVYPTETLYGIGANAWDVQAIERVRTLKQRAVARPILVLIANRETLGSLAARVSPAATRLMDAFWPGPLTLVFPAAREVPAVLTQGKGTIGIRLSASPLCRRLVEICGCPLTSTSANPSGGTLLRSVPEIRTAFPTGVDLYLDAGPLQAELPSTVIDVSLDPPQLLREGVLTPLRLREVVPAIQTSGSA
jgi:L-threonylcarbamoyladenylate synthase